MAGITKYVAYIELDSGKELGPVRVGLKTKIQAGKTAKAQGWNQERDAVLLNAFMAWHAAKAEGLVDMPWDEFLNVARDTDVQMLEDDDEDPENPTNPASLAG